MSTPAQPRVLIAPDSFKGHASARDAATWLGLGFSQELPEADIHLMPLADGGEGTAELFTGQTITLPTTDAAGRLTEASYLFDAASATAYIDVAAASGLPAVSDAHAPLTVDTYGTGVLIADAHSRGATRVVLALGGSATTDGGTGILVALGATPLDAAGLPLRPGGGQLGELASFDTAALNVGAASMGFVLLCDVDAPACGPAGTAWTFAPQKGASPQECELLDAAIANLCAICEVDPQHAGMGAAGAIPVGLTWLSRLIHGTDDHVLVTSGAAVVAASLGLAEEVAAADLVITGEGRLDAQSFHGKVVGTVAGLQPKELTIVCAFHDDAPDTTAADMILVDRERGTREQLVQAGAQAAQRYLRTSTVQG